MVAALVPDLPLLLPCAAAVSQVPLIRPVQLTPTPAPALALSFRRAAYALGFLDCNDISARCMLTIFQFFATKTGRGTGGKKENPVLGVSWRGVGLVGLRWARVGGQGVGRAQRGRGLGGLGFLIKGRSRACSLGFWRAACLATLTGTADPFFSKA